MDSSDSSSPSKDSGDDGDKGPYGRAYYEYRKRKKKKKRRKEETPQPSIVTFSDRRFRNEEKSVDSLRKLFPPPKEDHRVEWLIKLRRHGKDKGWSKHRYRRMLLQLWSREISYVAWRGGLPNLKPEALERRLLERDGPHEVGWYASTFPSTARPSTQRMVDWCQELYETRALVNLWGENEGRPLLDPQAEAITEATLRRVVQLRHGHPEMGRLLSQYKSPTWEELCRLAQIADEVYRSELKSRGPRRERTRRKDDAKVNHVGRDHDGTHHEEEWSDQAQDATVE